MIYAHMIWINMELCHVNTLFPLVQQDNNTDNTVRCRIIGVIPLNNWKKLASTRPGFIDFFTLYTPHPHTKLNIKFLDVSSSKHIKLQLSYRDVASIITNLHNLLYSNIQTKRALRKNKYSIKHLNERYVVKLTSLTYIHLSFVFICLHGRCPGGKLLIAALRRIALPEGAFMGWW